MRLPLPAGGEVSALLGQPADALAGLVLAHGAGAGMDHPFMQQLAARLAERGIATLRFQFPFMEQGSRRPDTPMVAQAAVAAAVAAAMRLLPGLPVFAGGKSFGGRMASQACAQGLLTGARGLVFVGFPLHPAGKPGVARAAHLAQVPVPMLFLQGTRDALADLTLIKQVAGPLQPRATLHVVDGADHAFHVLVRSGRTDAQVLQELAEATRAWMAQVLSDAAGPQAGGAQTG